MQAEQGGHRQAAPSGTGQTAKNQEQQDGVGGVEEDIGQVITPGIEAVKTVVEHEGPLGEGMPVGGHAAGQCEGQIGRRKKDVGVAGNVGVVIEFNELAAEGGKKGPDDQPEQQQAKEQDLAALILSNDLERRFQNSLDAKPARKTCPFRPGTANLPAGSEIRT